MTARTIDYAHSRTLIMTTGLVVLLVVAVVMFVRRVDPVEMVATLLFLPLFVAFLIGGIRAGVVGGLAATLVYVTMRWPSVRAVGLEVFAGLIATRAVGYLAFGMVGGWAGRQLRASITKMELFDQIDDETKLYNSRAALETIERERSRADRYHESFSVVSHRMELPLPGKERARVMRDLGNTIARTKRKVDVAMHGRIGEDDLLVVVLPETGAAGAQTYSTKLGQVVDQLIGPPAATEVTVITYPDESARLDQFLEDFRHIVAHDFPEAAPTT